MSNGPLRCRVRVGQRQELARDVAGVANVLEDGQYVRKVHVAGAGIPAIGVGDVKVEQPLAGRPDRARQVPLLNVHVERVQQQAQVVRPDPLDQCQPIGDSVDQPGLVAVQRLQAEAHATRCGRLGAPAECFHQPLHRLRVVHARLHHAPQEANDDLRAHLGGEGDVLPCSLDCRPPHVGVRIGEREMLLAPRLAGADGRHGQLVALEQRQQGATVHQGRVTDGQFDTVVPQCSDAGQVVLEIAPEGNRLKARRLRRQNDAKPHRPL